MPKIVKDGITYGSTSNIAKNITFDDDEANLKAFNVQTAIERLKKTIKNLSVLAPRIVDSISEMTDKSANYVLSSSKEIYQWVDGSLVPSGIYYKMSDTNAVLDFSEFDIELTYGEDGAINSISQTSNETNIDITFAYDSANGNMQSIMETDGSNKIKTTLGYNKDGVLSNISRKSEK